MKSLFTTEAHTQIIERLHNLNESSTGDWGKMSVDQMVWHCQAPLNIMLEKNSYGLKPMWLAKVFFKKSLYSDKPWRKGLPTARSLKTKTTKDFSSERENLVALIDETFSHRDKTDWNPHPSFGHFTAQQWGQMQYKHLDHHLTQFGV